MPKILYISLTGMTEPLGESQVVQYLVELAKKNEIYLVSFEKPHDEEKRGQLKQRFQKNNIQWKYFAYSNRYGIFSSLWQIFQGFILSSKWGKKENIQIIHARSLVPAVMGMLIKKAHKSKLLYDIRGFAIDEKILDGRLKEGTLLTKLLRKLETKAYKSADHIVTLTHASKKLLIDQYKVPQRKITVIPTCVNTNLFKPIPSVQKEILKATLGLTSKDIIIINNGSINGSIDFAAVVKLFSAMSRLDSNLKFLFFNRSQHKLIKKYLRKYPLPKTRYQIISLPFEKMNAYLNLADLYVFFIKPSFAKQASLPTKFAEGVACHIYSVTNTQYGDIEYYINQYPIGYLIELNEIHNETNRAADKVLSYLMSLKDQMANEKAFDELISEHFSHQLAVARYQKIYEEMAVHYPGKK